jgi:ATP-binding cassette subfamily B protein RaxB
MNTEQTIKKKPSILQSINLMPWRSMSRLPMIMQNEISECGLACLAMVSSFFGQRHDLGSIRNTIGVAAQDGINLKQIIAQAGHLGLSSRPVRAELMSLMYLEKPCILHWDMNHFVVLKKAGRKHIVIHDPAVGVVKMSYEQASGLFTGIAIEFEPNQSFERKDETEIPTLRSIMGRTQGLGKALAHILALSLLLQVVGLLSPALMQWMIDNALTSADNSIVLTVVMGMALLMVFNLVVGTIRSWMVMYLSINLGFKWSSRILTHLLHLPVEFFERRHLGDILSRFGSVSAIQQTITSGVISGILDGLLGIVTLVMIWLYSPMLAMTAVVSVVLLALVQFLTFEKQKRLANEGLVAGARVSSNLMESIRGIRPVKLAGQANLRKSTWQNLSIEAINIGVRGQWLGIAIGAVGTLISGGQRLIAIYLAATLITQGQFSVGMLFAYLAYQDQFMGRAGGLVSVYFQFKMLKLHFERLADIVLTEPEQLTHLTLDEQSSEAEGTGVSSALPMTLTNKAIEGSASVEFKNVSFKYSEFAPNIVENLSFSSQDSNCTVIVGRSGIGKTTIMKMILGIYKPAAGEILINGQAIDSIPVEQLRKHISCVLQDDALFAGSIRENIAFFDPEIDQDRVEECAKIACVHDDIEKTIMKYQTPVGDMGSTLSAGQKQRILIARALYRNPEILLLDEATSDLDVTTEEQLNKNLTKLDVHRIYIAHRPQTIKFGDQVVEIGTQIQ